MSSVALRAGEYAAEISTFGGGPSALTFRGEPLLVGYEDDQFPPLSSGIILAPWPNRTAEGVFAHDGELHRLEITEPGRATAIHGFVGAQQWTFVEASSDSVILETPCGPREGWPWALVVRAEWSLDAESGLTGVLTVANTSGSSCPLGLGWHPYLSAFGAPLDDCTLTLPVATNLPLDPVRNLPAGPLIDASSVLHADPREGIAMGGLWLDHCFGVREQGAGAKSQVQLRNSQGEGVQLWADEQFGWYQVFTADPARREGYPGVGRAVAVEPMTCPPNALRSGVDLLRLEAGERREFRLGVSALSR